MFDSVKQQKLRALIDLHTPVSSVPRVVPDLSLVEDHAMDASPENPSSVTSEELWGCSMIAQRTVQFLVWSFASESESEILRAEADMVDLLGSTDTVMADSNAQLAACKPALTHTQEHSGGPEAVSGTADGQLMTSHVCCV